jgi:hypothetical protein
MRTLLRIFSTLPAFLLGMAAFAQPLPPYSVTIAGTVVGCMPNSTVTIASVQNTQPEVNVSVPVGPNCNFEATFTMDSPSGWFAVSTPCLGAIQSATVPYEVNALDSTTVFVTLNCGSNTGTDCLGVVGGSAVPGTSCTTTAGLAGVWSNNCTCVASGALDCAGVPNGPNTPGTPCSTPIGATGTWSNNCDCIADGVTTDCMGVVNGPNVPGAACTLPNSNVPGTWSSTCQCIATGTTDCAGVPGGGSTPGTPCTTPNGATGTWSNTCDCVVSGITDCLGVPGGSSLPGTPCALTNSNVPGTWSNNCVCVANNPTPCQAAFWVMQAYTYGDSLNNPNTGSVVPIPFELWIWNQSSGGTGNYQFVWDFGDGNSSTDAFPTHVYGASGPYTICLTITDNAGCTSTYCEDVEVDQDGLLGMGTAPEVRSTLTIRVIQELPTGMADRSSLEATKLWPNPVEETFTLALNSSKSGVLTFEVIDLNGRVVRTEQQSVGTGQNRLPLNVDGMDAGMYMLRISNGQQAATLRFIKR